MPARPGPFPCGPQGCARPSARWDEVHAEQPVGVSQRQSGGHAGAPVTALARNRSSPRRVISSAQARAIRCTSQPMPADVSKTVGRAGNGQIAAQLTPSGKLG